MTKTKKILLVEDEQHLAKGLMFNLKKEGYEVVLAGNGELALECFSKNGKCIIRGPRLPFPERPYD